MNGRQLYLALFSVALFHVQAQGQTPWSWNLTTGPEVMMQENAMPHPFTGGMSAPQWSEVDVDWDGDMDLFTFDRDGGRILVFEKTSDGGWNERPDWSQGWPALKHWVLLRDFDCDGLPDLFTGYQNSIHVYRNTSAGPGVPTFEPYALPLTASWDFGTGAQELPLVCLTIDKPAIFDVDE
ncbi:MAG: FG-GAP repeat domain-containing protein, partial [Flavobacteriales bacterium]